MTPFTIEKNSYLKQNIQGFYHTHFGGVDLPNNPNFLYKLKNDPHHNWTTEHLKTAITEFANILIVDLPKVQSHLGISSLTVCVVPRSKADKNYSQNQLLFKATVKHIVNKLGLIDGTDYIIRHTNTKTTHLKKPMEGFNNDGDLPYVGITNATCNISDSVNGKDILLIDDIYTKTVNIDEDAIQTLLNKGAKSVAFYAIGNTVLKF
jgi:predicted amidophosphoribosyltransferase